MSSVAKTRASTQRPRHPDGLRDVIGLSVGRCRGVPSIAAGPRVAFRIRFSKAVLYAKGVVVLVSQIRRTHRQASCSAARTPCVLPGVDPRWRHLASLRSTAAASSRSRQPISSRRGSLLGLVMPSATEQLDFLDIPLVLPALHVYGGRRICDRASTNVTLANRGANTKSLPG